MRHFGIGSAWVMLFLSSALLACGTVPGSTQPEAVVNSATPYTLKDAVWLWSSPLSITSADQQDILQFCVQHNIGTIYLDIDDYLTLDGLDAPAQSAYDAAAAAFISSAGQSGISVHALGGDTFWANGSPLPLRLLNYVLRFNQSHPDAQQFHGLQYDVEFYADANFVANKAEYALNFLSLVDALVSTLAQQPSSIPFQLGFATPFGFDSDVVVPLISWQHVTKPLAFHVLDMLNRGSGTYVALMDYRNFAAGPDGSIEHAESELRYAATFTPNTRVVIAQDTSDASPPKTTFHGMPRSALLAERDLIVQHFSTSGAFGGMAIHDLRGYMSLR